MNVKISILLFAAIGMATAFAEDDTPSSNKTPGVSWGTSSFVKIKINGTAKGGEVSLLFPFRFIIGPTKEPGSKGVSLDDFVPAPTKITVGTTDGESAAAIAAKLKAKFEQEFGDVANRFDDAIEISGFKRGSVALHSTDAGIGIPAISNLKGEVTAEKFIKLTWTIPKGVVYDKIYIRRGDYTVGILKNNETEVTDEEAKTNKNTVRFEYRIIGVVGATPSDLAEITVAKP